MRPLRRLTIAAACVVATWLGAESARGAEPSRAPTLCTASQPDPIAFRLGSAGGSFGASSAIADFNRDGWPDLAVADRLGRVAGSTRFRLQIDVSGLESASFDFDSTDTELDVRITDIDHDHDLDVVLTRPLSGEAIAVWLNDGRGRFTAAALDVIPKTVQPDCSIDPSHADIATCSESESPRRLDPPPPASVSAAAPSVRAAVVHPSTRRRRTAILSAAAAPRSPPTHPDRLS